MVFILLGIVDWASWLCKFISFTKLGKFLIIISSNILFNLICSSFLWGSNYIYVRLAVSHISGFPPLPPLFFLIFFLSVLQFGYFVVDLFFSSLTLLHLHSTFPIHLIIVSISLLRFTGFSFIMNTPLLNPWLLIQTFGSMQSQFLLTLLLRMGHVSCFFIY